MKGDGGGVKCGGGCVKGGGSGGSGGGVVVVSISVNTPVTALSVRVCR